MINHSSKTLLRNSELLYTCHITRNHLRSSSYLCSAYGKINFKARKHSFLSSCFVSNNSPFQGKLYNRWKSTLPEQLNLSKPLILSKYTRLEFERKRAGLNDELLRELLKTKRSNFAELVKKHDQHYKVLESVKNTLDELGADATVVHRKEYSDELIEQSSCVFSVGGDGNFLQAAAQILSPRKALIGVNSDVNKSYGFLCLPPRCNKSLRKSFVRLEQGDFKWLLRKRIRLTMDCNGHLPAPIHLADEQIHFYHHLAHLRQSVISQAQETETPNYKKLTNSAVLPIRALNEVFVGEFVASGTSYFEMGIDGGKSSKHKSSGLIASTGTGLTAWFSSHRKLSRKDIDELLKIAHRVSGLDPKSVPNLSQEQLGDIAEEYLRKSVRIDASDNKMAYTVKDPLHNRVFASQLEREQGVASKLSVHSRLWDGCVIVDGNWAYAFDEGAWLNLQVLDEDALLTVDFGAS